MILVQEKKIEREDPFPAFLMNTKCLAFFPFPTRPTQKNLTMAKMGVWSKLNVLVIIAPIDTSTSLKFGEKLHQRVLMII